MRRPTLAAVLLLAAAPARACPAAELVALATAPLAGLKSTAFDAAVRGSAERASWQVYTRPDGRLHSIVRTDVYPLTGTAVVRASFLDARAFAITATFEPVDPPRGTPGLHVTATRSRKTFLFCEREGKILDPDGRAVPATRIKEPREERRVFEAPELAPFLKTLTP